MLIIGIDPASSENAYAKIELTGSHGTWSATLAEPEVKISPSKLDSFLKSWKKDDVLLIWDAPLTGPQEPHSYAPQADIQLAWFNGDFSIRALEQKLLKKIIRPESEQHARSKSLPGISIKHYTGCSHWAVTRALLGLPRIGRFDASEKDLPFQPLFADSALRSQAENLFSGKQCIVETHPAVALWCWLHDHPEVQKLNSWKYKGSADKSKHRPHKELRKEMLTRLLSIWEKALPNTVTNLKTIADDQSKFVTDDDCFDALIAAMLGLLYVTQKNEVKLYGSQKEGAMLLPKIECLSDL